MLITLVALLLLPPLYFILKRVFGSHPLDNIPGPKSSSWWNGHFIEIFGTKGFDFHFMMAERYGPTSSFRTLWGERQLYTFDPKAMHHIFVKDQGTLFEATTPFLEANKLMFGYGLLGTTGDQHRRQRKMLNPVFSIAHIREMVPIFYEVAHRLQKTLAAKVQDGPQEIDILLLMGRTALELIGQSGFGYSFDDLADEEHAHPYVKTVKGISPLAARLHIPRTYILPYISYFGTPSIRRFISRFLPWKDFQEGKGMADYMWALSKEVYREKKNAVNRLGKQLSGKDILSVLIAENEKASEQDRLGDDELIAQMSTLIIGAMDTTSNALSRILSLLATRPEVQAKLREEIANAFEDGDIPYDQLMSLPYLDAIARETMRVYPPFHRLLRTTLKDAIVPLSTPITCKDGSVVNKIAVPRNTDIFISLVNSNRNKAIWGNDADEWKPERWSSPSPDSLVNAKVPGVYSHLMTFSGGGRSCIGFKLAEVEMKLVLAVLIQTFEFSDTGEEIFWRSSGLTSPIVVGSGGHPSVPLMVKLVKRSL